MEVEIFSDRTEAFNLTYVSENWGLHMLTDKIKDFFLEKSQIQCRHAKRIITYVKMKWRHFLTTLKVSYINDKVRDSYEKIKNWKIFGNFHRYNGRYTNTIRM